MAISIQNGQGQFEHQGRHYWFDHRKIVRLDAEGPFSAGDAADFAAHLMGAPAAVRWLRHHFREQLPDGLDSRFDLLVRQITRRQARLKQILDLEGNLRTRPEQYPDASLWLRHRGYTRDAMHRVLYAAKGRELNQLRLALDLPDTVRPLPEHSTWMVLPYFSDWDTINCLRLEPVVDAPGVIWELDPSAHAWLGLQAVPPQQQRPVLHLKLRDALTLQQRSHDRQQPVTHLQVRLQADLQPARRFAHAEVWTGTNELEARQIIQMARLADRFQVVRADQSLPMDWKQHLFDQLHSRMSKDGFNFETRMLVEQLRDSPDLCRFITDRLNISRPEWVQPFRQHSATQTRLVRGNQVLAETSGGYTIAHLGGNQEQLISNFTIRLDQNIWFSDNSELWHAGRVLLDGLEYPVSFSRRTASKGDELEGVASAAVVRAGVRDGRTPVLFDRAHKRQLTTLINHQIATAPRAEGLRQLGWSNDGARFTTAIWRVDGLGVSTAPEFWHPANLVLQRCFGRAVPALRAPQPSDPLALLALLSANLARSQKGVSNLPVAVRNQPEDQATIQAVFAALGQSTAVSPKINPRSNPKRPFDPEDLNGLPLLLDLDPEHADRTRWSGCYLADSGLVPGVLTDNLAGAVAQVLQTLLVSLALRPATYPMPAEAGSARLLFEGVQLLKERCPGPWDTLALDQPTWRRLLWSAGLDGLASCFTLEPPNVVHLVGRERRELQALFEELQPAGASVRLEGDLLQLPLDTFNELVLENLGVLPTIERLQPDVSHPRLVTV